jgi:glucose-6-phosphate isomerase
MTSLKALIDQSSKLRDCAAFGKLEAQAKKLPTLHLRDLLDEPGRFEQFSARTDDLLLDYSRNLITVKTRELLLDLARERQVGAWTGLMFAGAAVNNTEDRPALHIALRRAADEPLRVDGEDIMPAVSAERDRVCEFAEAVRSGEHKGHTGQRITDVVNIGIGGSDLGLVMVNEALKPYRDGKVRSHFVSNIDGSELADVLDRVAPETTLFIICSKSFTTLETQLNANAARAWLLETLPEEALGQHFAAVSVNAEAMDAFGIGKDVRFSIWDWVGGRYSLWSAVGLTLAISLGAEHFRALLAGAAAMDRHFQAADFAENLPVLLAMVGVWNRNFAGMSSHAVLPYDGRLRRFPAFLQQLEMESNGKGVTRDGQTVDWATGPVIWGEPGSNAQHSFFQLLHQGTADVSLDFIAPVEASSRFGDQHAQGLANMLAQAEAFARGRGAEEVEGQAHKVHPGDRPANILLLGQLDPHSLGALIALYEHKVFVQSVIWGINPFDQWGVELGKALAGKMADALSSGDDRGLPGAGVVIQRWRRS